MTDWQQQVKNASNGDQLAVDELLESNLPRLRAFVRLRMGPQLRAKESVSDLVQSACREVLDKLDRFEHGSEAGFRRWLFATALRKVHDRVDFYKAEKRDAGREISANQTGFGTLADVYGGITPLTELDMRERVARVEAAFDRLSEDHREVVMLSRVVGLPHDEVAQAMGRSEEASRMLLFRALARLAAELEKAPESG